MLLVAQEVSGEKEDVGGTFGETPHEVGVPFGTEGDVDADAEAFSGKFALEIAADPVEHLEFKGVLVDVVLADEGAHGFDDALVVGGDTAEDAFSCGGKGDHAPHELDVVGVDVGLGGEGDLGRLFVGAFAEADADVLGEKALGVGGGAEEVGLEDGADGAGVQGGETFGDGEGGLGVGGAFHVDADEGGDAGGVLDHLGDDAFGEGGVEVHAGLREFYADVGVEGAGLDGIEELVVDGGGFAGFGFGGDAFAERVETDGDAFAVDLLAGGEGVFDGHAGDEAGGELASEGGALGETAEGFILREGDEGGSEQNGRPQVFAWRQLPLLFHGRGVEASVVGGGFGVMEALIAESPPGGPPQHGFDTWVHSAFDPLPEAWDNVW